MPGHDPCHDHYLSRCEASPRTTFRRRAHLPCHHRNQRPLSVFFLITGWLPWCARRYSGAIRQEQPRHCVMCSCQTIYTGCFNSERIKPFQKSCCERRAVADGYAVPPFGKRVTMIMPCERRNPSGTWRGTLSRIHCAPD